MILRDDWGKPTLKIPLTDKQHEIIKTVVARFINLRESTSRMQLLRKFKDPKAIDELLKRPFFSSHIHSNVYVPLPLAFEYCSDPDFLTRAQQATELALRILQNLDESHPEKEKTVFTREEYLNHARRICSPMPDEEVLSLGLHFATYFTVFSSWGGDNTLANSPNTFQFHEDIITLDPSKVWDEYVKAQDTPPLEAERRLPGEIGQYEPGFDFMDFEGAPGMRRAAVRPAGQYDYHPEIKRVSERLWLEGNFRQAVLDAFIHVIHTVRERTALPYDGDDLMNRAFSPDNRVPIVRFNPLRTSADKDEQRGIWNLFKGIVGLRNFKAHMVSEFDDPHRAHEYLALASLLMRLLDIATGQQPGAQGTVPPTP